MPIITESALNDRWKGRRYGRLTVVGLSREWRRKRHIYVDCQCDCGTITAIAADNLASGAALSCGCLRDDARRAKPHSRRRPSRERHADIPYLAPH